MFEYTRIPLELWVCECTFMWYISTCRCVFAHNICNLEAATACLGTAQQFAGLSMNSAGSLGLGGHRPHCSSIYMMLSIIIRHHCTGFPGLTLEICELKTSSSASLQCVKLHPGGAKGKKLSSSKAQICS